MLIIFTFLVSVAIVTEVIYDMLQDNGLSEVIKEKEEKGKTGDEGFEKEDSKVKEFQQISLHQEIANARSLFVLSHTYFTCSVYLSLPDIPPETA